MELSILIVQQIAVLMIIVAFGWLIVRFKLLNVEASKALSIITLYIICPCVILHSFQISFTIDKLQGFGLSVAGACIAQFFITSAARVIRPVFKLDTIEEGSVGYPNAGNLIIPLVMATMGEEWVFYCSAYIAVQTIMLWTHARTLISGNGWNPKTIFYNINIIAIIIGLFLFLTNISIPSIIDRAFISVGSMIGPASMLITGMLLGGIKIKEIFIRKRAYLVISLKMLILPAILALIFVIINIAGMHKDGVQILTITLLAASAPPASTIVLFAQIFDKDAEYASILNMMGVLVCIITMPLIILLYNSLLS